MAKPGRSPSSNQWDTHEHVASPVEIEAKKLLEAAGNREIAKHALDVVADANSAEAENRDAFAQTLGFRNYRSLVESSIPVRLVSDRQWYVTAMHGNELALWNDRDIEVLGIFESQADAARAAW
jgi:hypothetical protein